MSLALDAELPPLEEPQPTRKLYLLVCDQESPALSHHWYGQAGIGGGQQYAPSPTFRRATEADLRALGWVPASEAKPP